MRKRGTLPWLAALVALLVTGCGSSSAPLTHDQLVKRASGSCRTAARALGRVREPKTVAQYERTVNRSGFIVQRLYDNLSSLTPPAQDEARYKQFLTLLGQDIRAVHAAEEAVLQRKFARLAGFQNGRLTGAQREARLARSLGIARCAGVTDIELPKPPARTAGGGARGRSAAGGGAQLDRFWRAEFIDGCSTSAPRSACVCVYDQLTRRYGIRTLAQLARLDEQTRRALISRRAIDLPPAIKGAAAACRSKLEFR